jgi:hypothetical protein
MAENTGARRGRAATPSPARAPQPVEAIPTQSALDEQLALLGETATEVEETGGDRPQIVLPDVAKGLVREWADSKVVSKAVAAWLSKNDEAVTEVCFRAWVDALWQYKTPPANPELVLPDGGVEIRTVFVVRNDFRVKLPKRAVGQKTNAYMTLAEQFRAAGMDQREAEDRATKVVDENLSFSPRFAVREFDELQKPEERAALEKLVRLLNWHGEGNTPKPLTAQETALLVQKWVEPTVLPGFPKRVVTQVATKEQLFPVFKVIQPVTSFTAPEFKGTAASSERFDRLIHSVEDVIKKGEAEKG